MIIFSHHRDERYGGVNLSHIWRVSSSAAPFHPPREQGPSTKRMLSPLILRHANFKMQPYSPKSFFILMANDKGADPEIIFWMFSRRMFPLVFPWMGTLLLSQVTSCCKYNGFSFNYRNLAIQDSQTHNQVKCIKDLMHARTTIFLQIFLC